MSSKVLCNEITSVVTFPTVYSEYRFSDKLQIGPILVPYSISIRSSRLRYHWNGPTQKNSEIDELV